MRYSVFNEPSLFIGIASPLGTSVNGFNRSDRRLVFAILSRSLCPFDSTQACITLPSRPARPPNYLGKLFGFERTISKRIGKYMKSLRDVKTSRRFFKNKFNLLPLSRIQGNTRFLMYTSVYFGM